MSKSKDPVKKKFDEDLAALIIQEWKMSAKVQTEFGGDFNRYAAFRRAQVEGRVPGEGPQ